MPVYCLPHGNQVHLGNGETADLPVPGDCLLLRVLPGKYHQPIASPNGNQVHLGNGETADLPVPGDCFLLRVLPGKHCQPIASPMLIRYILVTVKLLTFLCLGTAFCSECMLPSYIVMSTIPKRKQKRSDIEVNYRNETKTFWCVTKNLVERFYLVQKLWIEIITFLCVPEPCKSKSGHFYVV